MSETAKNGFTFLLTFVTATIVCSIVAVKTFGVTLADCDWLHADAEQLLTLTNVVVVYRVSTLLSTLVACEESAHFAIERSLKIFRSSCSEALESLSVECVMFTFDGA